MRARPDPARVRALLPLVDSGRCSDPYIGREEALELAERILTRELWPFPDDSPTEVLDRCRWCRCGGPNRYPRSMRGRSEYLRAVLSVASADPASVRLAHELALEVNLRVDAFREEAAHPVAPVVWSGHHAGDVEVPWAEPIRAIFRYMGSPNGKRRCFYGDEGDYPLSDPQSGAVVGLRRDGAWAARSPAPAAAAVDADAFRLWVALGEFNYAGIGVPDPAVFELWRLGFPVLEARRQGGVCLAVPLDGALRLFCPQSPPPERFRKPPDLTELPPSSLGTAPSRVTGERS